MYDLEALLPVFDVAGNDISKFPSETYDFQTLSKNSVKSYLANGDSISSISFLHDSKSLLLSAVYQKCLRVHDLRHPASSSAVVAHSTSVRGVESVSVEMFEPIRFASYGDGTVRIWDLRNFAHPVLEITEHDAVGDGGHSTSQGG